MRQTSIKLLYNGKNISADIAKYLVNFSYGDNSSGEADDIQITLENTEHLWENDWQPEKGDAIEAAIVTKGFRLDQNNEEIEEQLYCGYFEVDEIDLSSPPSVVTIKAISTSDNTSLRSEENTKAWEKTTLKSIAVEIAEKSELELNYIAEYNPIYSRRDQTSQSDLAFLQELCERDGLSLKITNDTIIIFDEEQQEQSDPVVRFNIGQDNVIRSSFKTKTRDVYRACLIQYSDAQTQKTIKYIFQPTNAPETGQLLKINEKVESLEDAQRLARKRLREKNIKENTASMSVVGDTRLVAGTVITVDNIGNFSGNYYIKKANHDYGSSGYTVSIEMWKAGVNYEAELSEYIEVSNVKPRKRKAEKSKNKEWVGTI